jgi:hypothetical protein
MRFEQLSHQIRNRPVYVLVDEQAAVTWSVRTGRPMATLHYPDAAFASSGYPCELLAGNCSEQYHELYGVPLDAYESGDHARIQRWMHDDHQMILHALNRTGG